MNDVGMAARPSRLLASTLRFAPAQLAAPLIQLGTLSLLTFIAGEDLLGRYTLVVALQELFALVTAWWGHFAVRALNGEASVDGAAVWGTSRVVQTVGGCVQVAVGFVLLQLLLDPGIDWRVDLVICLSFVGRSLSAYHAQVAAAELDARALPVYALSGPAFGLVIGTLGIVLVSRSVVWPVLGCVVGDLGALAFWFAVGARRRTSVRLDMTLVREALPYGLPLIVGLAVGWLTLNAPRLTIDLLLGTGAMGQYGVGFGLGFRAASTIGVAVTAAGWPMVLARLQQTGRPGAVAQMSDNVTLMMAALLPAVFGLIAVQPYVIHLLVAPSFQGSVAIVLPPSLLVGALLMVQMHFAYQIFMVDRDTWMTIVWSCLDAAMTIGLTLIMTLWLGLGGAAWAPVISKAAFLVILLAQLWTRRGIRFPIGRLVRIGGATLAMVAVVDSLPEPDSMVSLLGVVIVGGIVYGAGLFLVLPEVRVGAAHVYASIRGPARAR